MAEVPLGTRETGCSKAQVKRDGRRAALSAYPEKSRFDAIQAGSARHSYHRRKSRPSRTTAALCGAQRNQNCKRGANLIVHCGNPTSVPPRDPTGDREPQA